MKESISFTPKKRRLFESLTDAFSFSQEVRNLVDVLNSEIASPNKVVFRPVSHPAGFVRLLTKRRLTIAEAYIKLVSLAKTANYMERIEALQVLVHHVWHSKNLSMPINTARVQIALMKNAVKMRGNRRAQLELMSDFARASYGQTSVIRRLLRELDLIEVPETGEDLSQMNLGWDDHVHDSMTEGRKSPTQLVLDAFIKGMSRITVAYYDVAERSVYEEVFLAGRILGIRVQIGIEFSVGDKFHRVHYLYVPRQGWEYEALNGFLDQNEKELVPFWDGLRENSKRRYEMMSVLLQTFNQEGLAKFNEPFADLQVLQMDPLSWESVETVTGKGQANRIHLGQLIYQAMKPVALKRVLYLRNQYRALQHRKLNDETSSWEADRCYKRYKRELHAYEELTPALCVEKYIAPQKEVDYASVFAREEDILPLLTKCGGYIVFIHPLSHGLQMGIDVIFSQYRHLTDVEVFNLVDAMTHDTTDCRRFASLLTVLETGTAEQVETLFREWRLTPKPAKKIAELVAYLKEQPFYKRCASDAVGWSSNIPGMGFILESSLKPKTLKLMRKKGHAVLPAPVAELFQRQRGDSPGEKKNVFLLSITQRQENAAENMRNKSERITPMRFWRYLNVNLRSLILAGIGFIPAYFFLGIGYALLWFAITGFRNAIVDLIASGLVPTGWRLKSIDRENAATSLFFTGFSVPIMTAAKWGFDWIWRFAFYADNPDWNPSQETDPLFTIVKFLCISMANGLYLASHNTLRGFDKAAIRGNFFRSILAWPLAAVGSIVLTPLGIPDVVQTKIWSDVVAGIIEGTVKTIKQYRLARKALLEVYRQIASSNPLFSLIARIDVLFFWAKYSQGLYALTRFMKIRQRPFKKDPNGMNEEIERCNTLIVDAFTTEGSLESLTYVILEYYPEENLNILTDFLGETHAPFVSWLEKIHGSRGNDK